MEIPVASVSQSKPSFDFRVAKVSGGQHPDQQAEMVSHDGKADGFDKIQTAFLANQIQKEILFRVSERKTVKRRPLQ
jgi:hypothetical protein